jgi:hypothetical protein
MSVWRVTTMVTKPQTETESCGIHCIVTGTFVTNMRAIASALYQGYCQCGIVVNISQYKNSLIGSLFIAVERVVITHLAILTYLVVASKAVAFALKLHNFPHICHRYPNYFTLYEFVINSLLLCSQHLLILKGPSRFLSISSIHP